MSNSTTFVDKITPIPTPWLNDVNTAVYNGLGGNTLVPNTIDQTIGNLSASKVLSTIAALRSYSSTNGVPSVFVVGYYAKGDGGGGNYYFDATDTTSADNGGTIIVGTDGGRWKLAQTSPISVLQFGAYNNSTNATTTTTAIQTCLNLFAGSVVVFPAGSYLVNPLTIPAVSNTELRGSNTILVLNTNGNLLSINGTGSDPNVNINIHGFIFQGNGKTSSILLSVTHVHGVRVADSQFFDVSGASSYHVQLTSAWIFEMDNCYLQAAAYQCAALLNLNGAVQQGTFTHTRFLSNATGDGVLINTAINNNFYGCDFEGNLRGVRIICTAGQRADTNNFDGCDFESNTTALSIGDSANGSVDPVIGTNVSNTNFIGSGTAGGIYLDKASRTTLDGISTGNLQITTTANTKQTYWKAAYGGTPTNGVTYNIAVPEQWIDLNMASGTFSPTVRSDNGSVPPTYNSQVGTYVRNGRTVFVSGLVYWTGWGSPGGTLQLVLPFKFKNQASLQQGIIVGSGGAGLTWSAGNQLASMGQPNTNWATVFQFSNTAQGGVPPTSAGVLFFSGTYQIEDV
jgi:hypothetical protein